MGLLRTVGRKVLATNKGYWHTLQRSWDENGRAYDNAIGTANAEVMLTRLTAYLLLLP